MEDQKIRPTYHRHKIALRYQEPFFFIGKKTSSVGYEIIQIVTIERIYICVPR